MMKHIKQRLVLKYKILVCRARMLFSDIPDVCICNQGPPKFEHDAVNDACPIHGFYGLRMTDQEIDQRLENVTR